MLRVFKIAVFFMSTLLVGFFGGGREAGGVWAAETGLNQPEIKLNKAEALEFKVKKEMVAKIKGDWKPVPFVEPKPAPVVPMAQPEEKIPEEKKWEAPIPKQPSGKVLEKEAPLTSVPPKKKPRIKRKPRTVRPSRIRHWNTEKKQEPIAFEAALSRTGKQFRTERFRLDNWLIRSYHNYLKKSEPFAGLLIIEYVIDPSGVTRNVEFKNVSFDNPGFLKILEKKIIGFSFSAVENLEPYSASYKLFLIP